MARSSTRHTITALVLALAACLPGTGTGPAVPAMGLGGPALPVPEEVTLENIELAVRRLQDMEATSEHHAALRTAIIHSLSKRFESLMADNRIEEAAETFRTALGTYSTEEVLAGDLPAEVASMARGIKDRFSPIGDEAEVMVALLVLITVHPDDKALRDEYETLSSWTEEAREGLADEAMRIIDLTSLYEEVARSLPLPSVVDRLLQLYRERQTLSEAAYEKMLAFDPSKGMQGLMEAAEATQLYEYLQPQVRRTSYLVTRLFTRIGAPTTALAILESQFEQASSGSMQNQVHVEVMLVLGALEEDPDHPSHWLALGRLLARNDDLDLARWACRRGWRLDPQDATFPLELGLLYRAGSDLQGAEEYLELALSLDEDKPAIYKNLLELYSELVAASLEEGDAPRARLVLDRMAPLLKRFLERWPNAKTDVTPADVERMRGLVAFEIGKVKEAANHFEKSIASGQDIRTYVLLGTLRMLTRDYAGAATAIDKALKVPLKKHGEAYYWKCVLLTLRGDVLDLQGKKEEAAAMWRQALDTGMEALPFVPLGLKAEMEARLGLLLHRLGRNTPAIDHLKRSIAGGATSETYTLVLSYLTARGDLEVSDVFYHYAATESSLPEKDQLMYATWYVALHWRTGSDVDPRAIELLSSGGGNDWPGPLMLYAAGSTPYEELDEIVDSEPLHQVPALYLRACELLGQGDMEGAAELLEKVLAAGQVADPHHAMALETLNAIDALE